MPNLYPLAWPLLRRLDPETAHGLTIKMLIAGLGRLAVAGKPCDPPALRQLLWGREFANPIGLAAGFDKDAKVPDAALSLGFGFVEIGTVTPRPQAGNPRPRLFRLEPDRAVVNRLGFNSGGLGRVVDRLSRRRRQGVVGVNLGKNRDTADAEADYAEGIRRTADVADYLVVNISSPNTPGLRDLQRRAPLAALLDGLLRARRQSEVQPPLLVKIAPDLSEDERADLAAVAVSSGIDGLIVSNTTVQRPASLISPVASEQGGLSGRPLLEASTALLAEMYRLTSGRVPLIGVGGIAGADDAYAKIRAGASLVQLYTALVFEGPALIGRIKSGLADRLRRDGFATVADAIGADHRPSGIVTPQLTASAR